MVAEVTDIKGIGPAKADTLAENGYETVEDVANANPDELADVDGVGDDRALEFIVGADDVLEAEAEVEEDYPDDETKGDEFDLTPSEVSDAVEEAEDDAESDSLVEDDADDSEEEETAESESEAADDGPDTYEIAIDFENRRQFDTFHAALMRHHERHYRGNQTVADAMDYAIAELDSFESVTYELTEEEINALHSAVTQLRTDYQGDNLIDHMDELKVIVNKINEQRRELLF